MTFPRILTGLLLLLAASCACAFDFRSIGAQPVIMYDAPSHKGDKLFVAPAGMPVEVVLGYGEWFKVRDASGDLSWVEAKGLVPRRTLIVRVASSRVRAEPGDDAQVVMLADRGVLLELVDPQPAKWVKVRHRDGITGYVRATDVWGI